MWGVGVTVYSRALARAVVAASTCGYPEILDTDINTEFVPAPDLANLGQNHNHANSRESERVTVVSEGSAGTKQRHGEDQTSDLDGSVSVSGHQTQHRYTQI